MNLKHFQQVRKQIGDNIEFIFQNKSTGDEVAYCRFKPEVGQIGILDVHKDYQKRGLGSQIITTIENELKENNLKEIWVACSKSHFIGRNVQILYLEIQPIHLLLVVDIISEFVIKFE